jgi:hypothetical protein
MQRNPERGDLYHLVNNNSLGAITPTTYEATATATVTATAAATTTTLLLPLLLLLLLAVLMALQPSLGPGLFEDIFPPVRHPLLLSSHAKHPKMILYSIHQSISVLVFQLFYTH